MTIESSAANTVPATTIKLASVNLFNFIEPPLAFYDFENIYSQAQWQKKCAWLSAFLQTSQADIVGFQEVFSPDALQDLTQAAGLTHFAVVDEPKVLNDYIYHSPVVALASRFNIVEVNAITPDAKLVAAMGLSSEFAFSRTVLRATVDVPVLGLCDCYIVHFKSKRAGLAQDPPALGLAKKTPQSEATLHAETQLLTDQALGRWASTMQRGAEAALLYHRIITRRQACQYPVVLMGDFNDSLTTGALDALVIQGESIHSGDVKAAGLGHLNEAMLATIFAKYQLQDAYDLCEQANQRENLHYFPTSRASTHYYGPKGSVLDYILLSSEFDAKQGASLAQVINYQTFDRHLVRPEYERDAYSTDHAPVMVELAFRS